MMGQVRYSGRHIGRSIRVIIHAAGHDLRVSPRAQPLGTRHISKQSAELLDASSLLQETVRRMTSIVPPNCVTVTIPSNHAVLARQQLAEVPDIGMVIQPENRGTAPALLLPLAAVLADDPEARVVVTPADHIVPDVESFTSAVNSALQVAKNSTVTLLGATPDQDKAEHGWVLPGPSIGQDIYRVAGIIDNPAPADLVGIRDRGALWNTLVITARGRLLWQMVAATMPAIAKAIAALWDQPRSLAAAYRVMPRRNLRYSMFDNDADMAVVPVSGLGWIQ